MEDAIKRPELSFTIVMMNDDLDDLLQRGYRYALSLTHDTDLAQDAVQDACLKISRRGGPWDIRYLITAIRHCHIDSLRRSGKMKIHPIEDIEFLVGSDMLMPSFDLHLEMALSELRDDVRELLYLSVVEGYTARELGELTGKPRNTILSILHRAKKKLRAELTQQRGVS